MGRRKSRFGSSSFDREGVKIEAVGSRLWVARTVRKKTYCRGGKGYLCGTCGISGGKSDKGEKRHTVSGSTHGPPNEMPVLTHQKNFPLLFSISF